MKLAKSLENENFTDSKKQICTLLGYEKKMFVIIFLNLNLAVRLFLAVINSCRYMSELVTVSHRTYNLSFDALKFD